MKEKIKKILKPFLAVIIAGFVVSVLYISLANRDIEKGLKEGVKLPEISGYDYSDLENRISDLESRTDDVESKADDNESSISDLESQIQRLKWDIDDLESRISDLEWKIRY